MVRKLDEYETNAIWTVIEKILVIPSKEVALLVGEDGKLKQIVNF